MIFLGSWVLSFRLGSLKVIQRVGNLDLHESTWATGLSEPVLWSCFSHIRLSELLSFILLHSDSTLVSLITNRKHLQQQKVNKLLGWNWIVKRISMLGSPFACRDYPAIKSHPLLKIRYLALFSMFSRLSFCDIIECSQYTSVFKYVSSILKLTWNPGEGYT